MKIYGEIIGEKLQMILREELQKHPCIVKLNYTNYSCTKLVRVTHRNYFFRNSN